MSDIVIHRGSHEKLHEWQQRKYPAPANETSHAIARKDRDRRRKVKPAKLSDADFEKALSAAIAAEKIKPPKLRTWWRDAR